MQNKHIITKLSTAVLTALALTSSIGAAGTAFTDPVFAKTNINYRKGTDGKMYRVLFDKSANRRYWYRKGVKHPKSWYTEYGDGSFTHDFYARGQYLKQPGVSRHTIESQPTLFGKKFHAYTKTDSRGYTSLYTKDKSRDFTNQKILLSSPAIQARSQRDWAKLPATQHPVDYATANASAMQAPLSTSHPKIYMAANSSALISEVKRAMHMWQPEIRFSLTNNPAKAQVVIKSAAGEGPVEYTENGDKAYAEAITNMATHNITLYPQTMRHAGVDSYGETMVIAHELGHALGLKHDTDVRSIMGNAGVSINRDMAQRYEQPTVTANNKRVLKQMYHEN